MELLLQHVDVQTGAKAVEKVLASSEKEKKPEPRALELICGFASADVSAEPNPCERSASQELQDYCAIQQAQLSSNPLEWWKENEKNISWCCTACDEMAVCPCLVNCFRTKFFIEWLDCKSKSQLTNSEEC